MHRPINISFILAGFLHTASVQWMGDLVGFRSSDNSRTSIYDALKLEESGVIAPFKLRVRIPLEYSRKPLLFGVSQTSYTKRFFCGAVNETLLGLMFRSGPDIELRFTFNSDRGGAGVPAGDYFALVPEPKPNLSYTF